MPTAVAVALALTVAGAGAVRWISSGDDRPLPVGTTPSTTAHVEATAPAPADLRLDFDQELQTDAFGRRFLLDTTGARRAYATGTGTAELRTTSRDTGRALKFPGPCANAPGVTCPRAILDIAHEPAFNPGSRDFAFGASVLLRPGDSSTVVQKGSSAGVAPDPNRWKIELIGPGGRPSCVVVAKGSGERYGPSPTSVCRTTVGTESTV